ncbi:hypothetical protein K7432_018381 [Basidiobolus ranarum]|uniref:Lysozyme n=1 Tax=Basidiobolus ranarum TaxID=34480 RepID=A0ABR2WC92_9FUNG
MQLTNSAISAKVLLLVLPSILSFASSVTAKSFPLNDGVNLRAGPGTNNGHINQAGLDLVKSFEGWFPNFYIDPVGEDLLRRDMVEFESCVNGLISASLTSNQFSALVSFSFNVGCGALRNSDMRRFINQGNNGAAAAEFGLLVRGGGKVLPGLVRRRKAERDLFCSGISC